MKIEVYINILIGLVLQFNINIMAYNPIANSTKLDSIFQLQDSSLQKIWEIENNSLSTTNILKSTSWFYFISDSGLINCYDFSSKEKWTTEVLGLISNNSVLYKDLLLTATQEGDLYSINSNNGEILQVVGIGENITTDLAIIEIATAGLKTIGVVLGTLEGNIFCYDAFTFELLWEQNISATPIISKPLVEKDKVIFLNTNSSLYSVNTKSGSLIWKYEFSDEQNFSAKYFPVSDGKNVFSLSLDGKLFALDLLLGKKTWSSNTKGVLNQFYISSDKQKLFLFDDKGLLTIYTTKNGKEIGKIDFIKSELSSFHIAENQENTLVGFSDGSLYTFDSELFSKELLSANQIPITSIEVIGKGEFIVKDINRKITFYKFK